MIVGSSTEGDAGRADVELLHAIAPEGRIIVAEEDNPSAVRRDYHSVEEWLTAEVDRAIKDELRF